jgi:hypothetical protein
VPLSAGALVLLGLTLILPLLIYRLAGRPSPTAPFCPPGQRAFVVNAAPGSYIDIVPESKTQCGLVPTVCLSDFDKNGSEKSSDDFFGKLLSLAQSSRTGIRIMPALNLIDLEFHYFIDLSPQRLARPANQLVSGCALQILTKNQSIYRIVSYATASGQ